MSATDASGARPWPWPKRQPLRMLWPCPGPGPGHGWNPRVRWTRPHRLARTRPAAGSAGTSGAAPVSPLLDLAAEVGQRVDGLGEEVRRLDERREPVRPRARLYLGAAGDDLRFHPRTVLVLEKTEDCEGAAVAARLPGQHNLCPRFGGGRWRRRLEGPAVLRLMLGRGNEERVGHAGAAAITAACATVS